MSRLLATDCQEITVGLSQTCVHHVLSGLTHQRCWTHTRDHSAFAAQSPLSPARMLPSALIKRIQCACTCLSQSVNSSGFSRTSPHWSFLAVQNNFLGWLYIIRCQSKLQVCTEIVANSHRNSTESECAWCKHGDGGDTGPGNPTAAWLIDQRFTNSSIK